MDIIDAIKKLAQAAREEPAPKTDVTDSVLLQIREQDDPVTIAPFWIMASASAAAAAVVLALTAFAWAAWNDPLIAMFVQFRMVTL
ncbi:MAG: hypothetical protein GXP25_03040 [Planctomycetes bacterium]|nr:hypothetical protein [Planctomycetota bacterium]